MDIVLPPTISDRPLHRSSAWELFAASSETPVNVFDRPPPGFEPDEGVGKTSKRRPGREIEEARKDCCDRDVGLDDIRRTDDQREPNRTDDLPNPPKAISRAHPAGAKRRRPYLGSVEKNDRRAPIAQEIGATDK